MSLPLTPPMLTVAQAQGVADLAAQQQYALRACEYDVLTFDLASITGTGVQGPYRWPRKAGTVMLVRFWCPATATVITVDVVWVDRTGTPRSVWAAAADRIMNVAGAATYVAKAPTAAVLAVNPAAGDGWFEVNIRSYSGAPGVTRATVQVVIMPT